MKAKTIRRILSAKLRTWLNSIDDKELKIRIQDNTIITGGAIVSLLLNEEVKDFDVYFRDQKTALLVAQYYVDKYKKANPPTKFKNSTRVVADIMVEPLEDRIRIFAKSVGVVSETQDDNYQYFETLEPGSPDQDKFIEEAMVALKAKQKAKKGEYRPIFLTSNAITLSSSIQLIIRFFGEADEIHKNYDFIHCTNYWTSWDNKLVLKPKALEAILTKELRYQGSLYPLTSIIRTRKFIKRGWTINAGQYLKMAVQLSQLDLFDPDVLQDQLIGVDVFYFIDLINRIKETDKPIDEAYIVAIIDEIF